MSFDNPQHNQENIDREETPFFSIIIPVFNTQDFIEECLNSCISQTFQNLEILVVDDRGEDQSMQIVQKFASKDSRIKIITHPKNLGSLKARLSGISQAQGEYCLFVDSDDFVDHQMCEILHQALTSKQVDILHFKMQYFPKTLLKKPLSVNQKLLQDKAMRNYLNLNNTFQNLCDKAFKTKILKASLEFLQTIQYPLCFMEDGIITLVVTLYAHSYLGINRHLYFYRNNPNSMTRRNDSAILDKKSQDYIKLLEISQSLIALYPQHHELFKKFSYKIVSSYIIGARNLESHYLALFLSQIRVFGFKKNPPRLNTYLCACILSYRYFKRWQTLVRIGLYCASFGKIRL